MNRKWRISNILKDLGISASLSGYLYLRDAIELCMDNPQALQRIHKLMYPELALKYKTTDSAIERAIRHAIETGWLKCDLDLVDNLFGSSLSASRGKPTNKEFIASVADYLTVVQED